MNVYLVGIGGTAAAYLVDLAKAEGFTVAGSDGGESEAVQKLRSAGVKVKVPQNAGHISKVIDELWYSAAITESSPGFVEVAAARELGIPTLTFAEAGARFFNRAKIRIAVAGTHGKSTTTAMVGWILEKCGLNPTVALGAEMHAWGGNCRVGDLNLMVMEADEYARRFLELRPTHAIVTSAEPDHFDTYPTVEEYRQTFNQFVHQVEQSLIIHFHTSFLASSALPHITVTQYGLASPAQSDTVITVAPNINQHVVRGGKLSLDDVELKLKVPGQHNLENALAAVLVCSAVGVQAADAARALADFPGVARRFEFVGKMKNDALIYDDYGHHPTEIIATVNGARDFFPDRQIILVYQPHQAGRLAHLMTETAAALTKADQVVLLPVFTVPGRENPEDVKRATSQVLQQEVRKMGGQIDLADSYEEAAVKVKKIIRSDSLVLTMGATDVWKVGRLLLDKG